MMDEILNMDCNKGLELIPDGSVDLIIMDPFMGTGTTAVACKGLGRHYIGFEIEPKYHQIAMRRLNEVKVTLDEWN